MKTVAFVLATRALVPGSTARPCRLIGDGNQGRSSRMRLYACTEVIDGLPDASGP